MTAKLVSVATGLVPISYVKLNCGGKFDKHLNCTREGIHFISFIGTISTGRY